MRLKPRKETIIKGVSKTNEELRSPIRMTSNVSTGSKKVEAPASNIYSKRKEAWQSRRRNGVPNQKGNKEKLLGSGKISVSSSQSNSCLSCK